jgi:tetratricopeptide (TPR) repeat protein
MKEARKIVQAVKENVIGNDALKRGEFEKAIRHFTAALDLDPQLGTFGFFTTRAIAAYKLGRYVDCLEDVKLAQKVDSKAVLVRDRNRKETDSRS